MSRCRDCMYRDVQLLGLPSSYSGQLHTEGPPLHLEAGHPQAGQSPPQFCATLLLRAKQLLTIETDHRSQHMGMLQSDQDSLIWV